MGCRSAGRATEIADRLSEMRVLILSDLHLGSQASRSHDALEKIRHVARQYDRVILNGDTLDRFEAPGCEPKAATLIKDAADACRAGGGEAEFLTGNHDPAISDRHWVYLAESGTLVFHGDCVCDATHPTRLEDQHLAARLRERWNAIGGRPQKFAELSAEHRVIQRQFLRERPPISEPRSLFQYVLNAAYPPQKSFHILRYWTRVPRLAAKLAATLDEPVRHVAVGHTHFAGRWDVGGITVMNTGSFMPVSRPHAVCIDGERVRLVPVSALLASTRSVFVPLTAQPESKRA